MEDLSSILCERVKKTDKVEGMDKYPFLIGVQKNGFMLPAQALSLRGARALATARGGGEARSAIPPYSKF